jgi:hypothetical protein
MRRRIGILLVGALVLPRSASGQSLAPGARVRFSYAGEGRRTGTVVSLTRDTLVVRLGDGSPASHLALDRVARLEVSEGMESRTRYVKKGLIIGGGIGALAGLIAPCSGGPEPICVSPLAGAVLGGIGGGAEGSLVGLIVGVRRSEKWEWVPLEWRHLGLVTPSAARGRGVGLRISF